ncbi:multicopper oxidase domain-containing protein [Geobacter sp.]|uniref:multicopper oxidase domain-containing protein n=1 Tax=Geobacter sp. TaxID=46610 RepID=UPI00260FBF00|nr:multicopper oxidase domain-containing protein [Geobacter sp.]
MTIRPKPWKTMLTLGIGLLLLQGNAHAQPVAGGTLDPTTIPKYVTPLVIPPVMSKSTSQPGAPAADYNIAVRQFKQQILPGGVWNTVNGRNDTFGATTVWSYGRAQDVMPANFVAPAPLANNISFNYPAFTVENSSGTPTSVRWINGLVDANGNYLPHLFAVDQTLHWANPPATGCADGTNHTDCRTLNPNPYTGPVPMVVHVHGSHVNYLSDGYPEAWWLPAAKNIPAGYARYGRLYDQYNRGNKVPGSAFYAYENDQPATTLWYHDHSLGITRNNVYAGPAGFWLIRGGANGDEFVDDGTTAAPADGKLPGPAPTANGGDPNFDPAARATIREIPVVIQDRSFNADGSLFYPSNRAFFERLSLPGQPPQSGFTGILDIPFIPVSDISPIWNPEAFFNTMVVNGSTWPVFEVAPARYRLRLLNGCNSRTLNLALFQMNGLVQGPEVPFYQIGAEQGFLPKVVMVQTGSATPLPGDGTIPAPVAAPDPQYALLVGPAERADVIVDFTGMPDGTVIRMVNTAPDNPFGGFPDVPADPGTSGQVMEFVVRANLTQPSDAQATPPQNLVLPAEGPLGAPANTRQVTLNEEESSQLCVAVDALTGSITTIFNTPNDPNFAANCAAAGGVPMAPKAAKLGVFQTDPVTGAKIMSLPKMWADAITETPTLGDTEMWEIYNFTVDGHPIHIHMVRFEVIDRQPFDILTFATTGPATPPKPNELGYKDTVIALPGQITRLKAKFDKPGLYVWHCHILEHEDNEMMRPYVVKFSPAFPDLNGDGRLTVADVLIILRQLSVKTEAKLAYDLNGDGRVDLLDALLLLKKVLAQPRLV